MKREELRQWILAEFDCVEVEKNEDLRVEIFKINLKNLAKKAEIALQNPENLGDFEQKTWQNRLEKFENSDETSPIFAVLDEGEFPVRLEVKTDAPLAKILREKESVVPSKILDERTWSRIIGFGQISEAEAQDLLRLSYRIASEK